VEEHLEATFVYTKHFGKRLVSGSVNWAKAGRSFKLEPCLSIDLDKDCYLWSEINKKHW